MLKGKRKIAFLIVMGFSFFVWQFYLQQSTKSVIEFPQHPTTKELTTAERYQLLDKYMAETLVEENPPFKRIVFWNEAYGNKEYGVGFGREALRKHGCPVWQCETTDNRTDAHTSDAVLFHLRSWTKNDLPEKRLPHQRYVFWSMESPVWREYAHADQAGEFFNWTMTYRWDSDMVATYANIKPIGKVPLHFDEDQVKFHLTNSNKTVNYAKGKTKMAAWFVSNCNSKSSRNEFVKELQKHIDVDVYGKCGTMKCPTTSDEECRDMAAKDYKFFMSLENSLCPDYITEKFFVMMNRTILPIVYGVHDSHEKIAPTHSFINAAKFENVKKLADYLISLDKNDTLYNEYFWWKPHFKVMSNEANTGMCRLCAALHDKSLPSKIYHDMTGWWEKSVPCVTSPKIV
ncbi:alpha-(1,3)-fucosyltransferase C-like [Daphnia carinata]|uniref:alpha-(1,3)-fucosyltransferase C-like n=1 Tax=Daphnia carinata TaxID=120202 RepID=UPI00257B05AE|nr:alpha-(1,3)-fucosyltransferase C-like [Daphnia carinata]